jgi:hypothetical protein
MVDVQARDRYCAGMQYTIRDVPRTVDAELRRKAKREARSLNAVALHALKVGAGVAEVPAQFHDLDALAGTWQEDAAFDRAVAAQDQVDARLWK